MALKDGAKRANPVILEPVMKIEVTVPEDYMAMSSATSTRAAEEFKTWKPRISFNISMARYRFRKCSDIPHLCGLLHRAEGIIIWNLRTTKRFPADLRQDTGKNDSVNS